MSRNSSSEAYEAGLRGTLRAAGGDLAEEFVFYGSTTSPFVFEHEQEIWDWLVRTMCREDRPTAVMTSFDSAAEMVFLMLDELGLRVPEDVSLTSFGSKWRETAIIRQLATAVIDTIEVGRTACSLLDEMRDGRRPLEDGTRLVMPLEWLEGHTLGTPPRQVKTGTPPRDGTRKTR